LSTAEPDGLTVSEANQSGRAPILRRLRRAVPLCLALTLVLSPTGHPATGMAAKRVSKQRVAPGVVHMVIRKKRPRLVIHVVKADLNGRATIRSALAGGKLPGLERTSSMARRRRAVAAINGDFFRPSGRPIAAFAQRGRLAQTALMPGANFAIARGDRNTFIGHRRVTAAVKNFATGRTLNVARVNSGRPGRRGLALYTPHGGTLERPPRGACSARLRQVGRYRASRSGGMSAPFRVRKVACTKKRFRRAGATVLSARWSGPRRKDVTRLKKGQRMSITSRAGWPRVVDTIGGNPVLIRNGRIEWDSVSGSHSIFRRHPRTGVGVTKDGKVLLVTVDGRRPRHSVGMTLTAFARLFKSLGAEWALNLDGGGSTTMVVRGRVVNRPSDKRERPVGSALVITMGSGGSTQKKQKAAGQLEAEVVDGGVGDGLKAALDPASIGGMASWLEKHGELTPNLQGVADRFNDRAGATAPR
jgi:hypothetical protein